MKKLLIISLLFHLMLPCVLTAQNKPLFKSFIEGGYYTGSLTWKHEPYTKYVNGYPVNTTFAGTNSILEHRMYTNIGMSVSYKGFSANTSTMTIISPITWHSFQPLQTEYSISLAYQYKQIMFNAEHMCTHSTEQFLYSGSYTKFGIRVYLTNSK